MYLAMQLVKLAVCFTDSIQQSRGQSCAGEKQKNLCIFSGATDLVKTAINNEQDVLQHQCAKVCLLHIVATDCTVLYA